MARTLSDTLAAAVDAPARQPAMQFTLRDGEHHYELYRTDPRSAAASACVQPPFRISALPTLARQANGPLGQPCKPVSPVLRAWRRACCQMAT